MTKGRGRGAVGSEIALEKGGFGSAQPPLVLELKDFSNKSFYMKHLSCK